MTVSAEFFFFFSNFNFFSPDIFILDDPISSLDNETADLIMKNIKTDAHWSAKTFVIATNRLKMINYADKVVHMNEGRVEFFGTPDAYLETEQYKSLNSTPLPEEEKETLILVRIRQEESLFEANLNSNQRVFV